jgi:hypothetical protein
MEHRSERVAVVLLQGKGRDLWEMVVENVR